MVLEGKEATGWATGSRKGRGKQTKQKKENTTFLCLSETMRASVGYAGKCRQDGSDEAGHTGVFPPGNSLSLEHCFPVWRVMNTTVDPICFFSSVEPTLCCQPCGFIGTAGSLEKHKHCYGFWVLCLKRNVWIVLFDKKRKKEKNKRTENSFDSQNAYFLHWEQGNCKMKRK